VCEVCGGEGGDAPRRFEIGVGAGSMGRSVRWAQLLAQDLPVEPRLPLGGLGGALARRLHAAAHHGHVEAVGALVVGG
jgi:hypothetical protein